MKARREIQDELRLRRADELRAKEQAGNTTALAREEGGRLVVGARRAEALTVKAPPSCSFGPPRVAAPAPPVRRQKPRPAPPLEIPTRPDTPVLDTLDDYTEPGDDYTEPGESSDEARRAVAARAGDRRSARSSRAARRVSRARRDRGAGARPPSPPRWRAGALVEARFCGMDEWYPGRVVRVAEDGAVDIEYEDGDYETALPPGHVRERAGAEA